MPPRRQPPPRTESKTGLVVALVFFILTTIGTGTAAYLGFDGQKEYEKKAQDAQKEKEKATADAASARAEADAMRMMIGITTPNEAEMRGYLSNKQFTDQLYTLNEFFKPIGVEWSKEAQAAGKPPESVLAAMKRLKADLDKAEGNAKNALVQADQANTNAQAREASAAATVKAAQTKQKEALDGQLAAQKAAEDAKNSNADKIAEASERAKKAIQAKETSDAEYLIKSKKANEQLMAEKQANERLQSKAEAERQKIVLKDQPRGEITRVDADTGTAFINLGSADAVRPSLTFSILLPTDLSQVTEDSPLPKKATVEVQQVLGPHQSRVTIRYADDVNPIKNPVETSDKLYKPGWNKGQPIRLALIGHFDTNGYGTDETALLARRLEKQGIIVQAYYDLANLKWVGELNNQVDYLILGDLPSANTTRMLGEERSKLIETKIVEEVEKARSMHIMIFRAKQFLPATGIDLPRNPLPAVFPATAGAAGPAGGAAPAKPEEKPKTEGK